MPPKLRASCCARPRGRGEKQRTPQSRCQLCLLFRTVSDALRRPQTLPVLLADAHSHAPLPSRCPECLLSDELTVPTRPALSSSASCSTPGTNLAACAALSRTPFISSLLAPFPTAARSQSLSLLCSCRRPRPPQALRPSLRITRHRPWYRPRILPPGLSARQALVEFQER